jgi:hypothetical protein
MEVLIGQSPVNDGFSIAMFDYQRVTSATSDLTLEFHHQRSVKCNIYIYGELIAMEINQ